MTKEMVINAVVPENVRVAVLHDGRLIEFFEETQERFRTRANVYIGKVTNVEPSLEACFVEYGESRQGFLPASEIVPVYWSKRPAKSSAPRITTMVRRNQYLLVQVEKEPTGTKGARLTTDISLAGRYLVLMPYSDTLGVSRKIDDQEQRKQVRDLGAQLKPPKGMGIIIRTAGRGQAKRPLARDMNYLIRLWKEIQKAARNPDSPRLLHAEAELVQRVLRDYYTDDIDKVWIDDTIALDKLKRFFKLFTPRQQRRLKVYSERVPIFSHFGIEEQIEGIHRRKVPLPSGGSLVIDQTEALVAIDVNSGKMKGQRNQEQTAFETNMEASVEIARQLRLRNLGGIVVIDFIDMSSNSHNSAIEKSLKDEMRNDKARRQVSKISAFGLCTLTRQRLDHSIRLVGFRECPTCKGDGIIRAPDATAIRLLRKIQTRVACGKVTGVQVKLHPDLANHIQNRHRSDLLSLEREFGITVAIEASADMQRSEEQLEFRQVQEESSKEPAGKTPEPASAACTAAPSEPRKSKKSRSRSKRKGKGPKPETGREGSLAKKEGAKQEPPPSEPKKRRRRRRKKKSTATSTASEPAGTEGKSKQPAPGESGDRDQSL